MLLLAAHSLCHGVKTSLAMLAGPHGHLCPNTSCSWSTPEQPQDVGIHHPFCGLCGSYLPSMCGFSKATSCCNVCWPDALCDSLSHKMGSTQALDQHAVKTCLKPCKSKPHRAFLLQSHDAKHLKHVMHGCKAINFVSLLWCLPRPQLISTSRADAVSFFTQQSRHATFWQLMNQASLPCMLIVILGIVMFVLHAEKHVTLLR